MGDTALGDSGWEERQIEDKSGQDTRNFEDQSTREEQFSAVSREQHSPRMASYLMDEATDGAVQGDVLAEVSKTVDPLAQAGIIVDAAKLREAFALEQKSLVMMEVEHPMASELAGNDNDDICPEQHSNESIWRAPEEAVQVPSGQGVENTPLVAEQQEHQNLLASSFTPAKAMQALGQTLGQAKQRAALFGKVDTNDDGVLDVTEFSAAL